MPKGVEHPLLRASVKRMLVCRSQRCRKALSTRPRRDRASSGILVPKSEMPKGVEHLDSPEMSQASNHVPKSEMPKGVEHLCQNAAGIGIDLCRSQRCRKALSTTSPTGVYERQQGAEVRDAERR